MRLHLEKTKPGQGRAGNLDPKRGPGGTDSAYLPSQDAGCLDCLFGGGLRRLLGCLHDRERADQLLDLGRGGDSEGREMQEV